MKRILAALLIFILLAALIAVHQTEIISTHDITLNMLQNRKGTILVEKCIGMVGFDNKGMLLNGNANNYYIGYRDVNANAGDIVLTYFVYNPFNNVEDDIIWRIDFVL